MVRLLVTYCQRFGEVALSGLGCANTISEADLLRF